MEEKAKKSEMKANIFSKVIMITLILLGGFFVNSVVGGNVYFSIFSIVGIVIVFLIMILWLKKMVREEQEQIPYQNYKHEGLFGEIWNDIDKISQIEGVTIGCLDKDGNIIDEDTFGVVIDEEEDNPLEIEVPLSEIIEISEFWKLLTEIIRNHS